MQENMHALAPRESFLPWLKSEIRTSFGAYTGLTLFIALTFALSMSRGESLLPFINLYGERIPRALALVLSALILVLSVKALLRKDVSPLRSILRDAKTIIGSRFARFVYACALLAIFMAAFLYHKMYIPELAPFQWDETFARWDAVLFAGRQPWEIMQPIVGYPVITIALDIVYSSWVPMVFVFWAGLLVSARVPVEVRIRYWCATVACWIIVGLGMATLFSSAGPCYFPNFVPGAANPFEELLRYLDSVDQVFPLSQMRSREHLWDVYLGKSTLPGGISAMPSMHNAQAVLFVAVAFALDRRFGWCMLAYAAAIFVGSVHLAWHYALDGIVGIAAASCIWWASGLFTKVGLTSITTGRSATQAAADPVPTRF